MTTGAPGSAAAADITGDAPSQVLNLKIPQGATGAVSAWEYYAAGRPDVVGTLDAAALAWSNAAPSGSTFYSTDGPQGAWVWRRRGATWVCVEGDTGSIDALSMLRNLWTSTRLTLRRINGTVTLVPGASLVRPPESPSDHFLAELPLGFRPLATTQALGSVRNSSGVVQFAYSAGTVCYIFAGAAGIWTSGPFSWATGDSWPTTLTV